ncbi:MFS transporter [Amycolatopsis sp. NPDC006131]|uniref:MFS transporter n=1 Tax=Amycolatopsis sp. NPDC006131 TaxID=3156731 RepID=UPI0033B655C0
MRRSPAVPSTPRRWWSGAGFARLWAAQTLSRWGDVFAMVALPLLVLRLTGSGLGVSLAVVAEIVPVLLFAPLAGVVVDRIGPRPVMISADLLRAALAGVLPLLSGQVSAVYAIAFALAAGGVFFNPAAAVMLPRLVAGERLVVANSALWTAAVLSQIVLAPLAGALVAFTGFTAAFGINAASFLVSAALLAPLPAAPDTSGTEPQPPGPTSRWREAAAGLRTVTGDRLLRTLAAGQALAALSAGATSALLVVLAREHLHAGPQGFGMLLAAIGIGAATGPLLLTVLSRRTDTRHPGFVFGPFALRGVVDLILASVGNLATAATALAAYGVGTSTGAVTFTSLLQTVVPEPVRGRVFAVYDMLWQAGRLASLLVGGFVADLAGVRVVYLIGGALLLVAALLGLCARRLNQPTQP